MKKKRILIIVILGIVIVLLILGILLTKKKQEYSIITLSDFETRFTSESKNLDDIYPLEKYSKKKDDEKQVYQFQEDFSLVVSYQSNQQVEKAYFYIKKDDNTLEFIKKYLPVLVHAMNSKLSDDDVDKIVEQFVDIEDKKADEFGFLTEFKKDNNTYIVLEKENGKYLSFFIYND